MYIYISSICGFVYFNCYCLPFVFEFLSELTPPTPSRYPHIFIFIWIFTVIFCLNGSANKHQRFICRLFLSHSLCVFFPVLCCPKRCELFKPNVHIIWHIYVYIHMYIRIVSVWYWKLMDATLLLCELHNVNSFTCHR